MSERKVINKYYPADFDPSKVPRRKLGADRQQVVRLMAPFSMRCNTCGEYIYKGKKFNARKETVQGETYYGIRIFRFYIKCTRCSAEITFKTDPRNTDYAAEHGASRNFEPWRDGGADGEGGEGGEGEGEDVDPLAHLIAEEEERESGGKKRRDAELDPMKALEARTLESKREMEVLDALQDIQTRNARNERADTEAILAAITSGKGKGRALDPEEEERRRQEEEDEMLVRRYFSRAEDVPVASGERVENGAEGTSKEVDRVADDEEEPHDGANGARIPNGDSTSVSNGDGSREAAVRPSGLTVKRAIDDVEPDVTALLSEKAKAQLAAATSSLPLPPSVSRPTASPAAGTASTASKTAAIGVSGGPAKKKQKGNAFGLVRKK